LIAVYVPAWLFTIEMILHEAKLGKARRWNIIQYPAVFTHLNQNLAQEGFQSYQLEVASTFP